MLILIFKKNVHIFLNITLKTEKNNLYISILQYIIA